MTALSLYDKHQKPTKNQSFEILSPFHKLNFYRYQRQSLLEWLQMLFAQANLIILQILGSLVFYNLTVYSHVRERLRQINLLGNTFKRISCTGFLTLYDWCKSTELVAQMRLLKTKKLKNKKCKISAYVKDLSLSCAWTQCVFLTNFYLSEAGTSCDRMVVTNGTND